MRAYEAVTLVYAVYLVAMAWVRTLPGRRRHRITAIGLALIAVVACARFVDWPGLFVRDIILPILYLLAGYWLSGMFFDRPMPRVERWLSEFDRRAGVTVVAARLPRIAVEGVELAYLFVYPLVPIAFAVLYSALADPDLDHFWTLVIASCLICYGGLPWIQTRPPRALEPVPPGRFADSIVRRLNLLVLTHGSIRVNTVPSGHAAGALAIALAITRDLPIAGAIFFVVALGIISGSVFGRYHYLADSITGVIVTAVVWLIVEWRTL